MYACMYVLHVDKYEVNDPFNGVRVFALFVVSLVSLGYFKINLSIYYVLVLIWNRN